MKTPAIVISGSLGAGKTTLVRRTVSDNSGYRFGVVVNEFGEVGVDGDLLKPYAPHVVEIKNGCLCCVTQDQLVPAVKDMLARYQVDILLLEMSGEGEPGPVLNQLQVLRPLLEIRNHVVVADASATCRDATRHAPFLRALTIADQVVLSKTDIASASERSAWNTFIGTFNPEARLTTCVNGRMALSDLLAPSGSKLRREDVAHPAHSHALSSYCAFVEPMRRSHLDFLIAATGPRTKRIKGIAKLDGNWMEVQSVRGSLAVTEYSGPAPARGRLVFLSDSLTKRELEETVLRLLPTHSMPTPAA